MGKKTKIALVMSGGGARAAYQIGVLKGLAEILPKSHKNPFKIICGTSAGAINAASLAAQRGGFHHSVECLCGFWDSLEAKNIYGCGWSDLCVGMGRLSLSLFHGGVGRKKPLSLLDNTPLREMLLRNINLENISKAIELGELDTVSVTAMGYSAGESVSFFQANPSLKEWRRHGRSGTATELAIKHLMASSAIPSIFPAVRIHQEYFGDGALRQVAPISPALHLGADKVFVVGVSSNQNPEYWGRRPRPSKYSPSMGQIVGHLFNSAFIDGLEGDIEHLERVNELLSRMPRPDHSSDGSNAVQDSGQLRPVESMVISPSAALDIIAGRKIRCLPRPLRYGLRAVGATAKGGGATAASYLLFSQPFIQELIGLGYQDVMWSRAGIEKFFEL